MTILYTGRKASLTPALKAMAEGRLEKLGKVLGDILDARVVLKREKHRQVAEMVVKARTRTLTATGEAATPTDAIAAAAERLLAQARRHADRRIERRKGRAPWKEPGGGPAVEAASTDGLPEVVRSEPVRVRRMSVREALLRARDEGLDVLVFRDLKSQQLAVLCRRPDGRYGLVETEA